MTLPSPTTPAAGIADVLIAALCGLLARTAHIKTVKLQRMANNALLPTEGWGGLTSDEAKKILAGRRAIALAAQEEGR